MTESELTSNEKKVPRLRHFVWMALAAVFSTSVLFYFLSRWEARKYEISYPDRHDLFILSLFPIAYLLAAVLCRISGKALASRKILLWAGVAFCGSFLFILLAFIYAIFGLHGNIRFITAERLLHACLFALGLSVYASVFTALVYYFVVAKALGKAPA